jgi:hypothetical protein
VVGQIGQRHESSNLSGLQSDNDIVFVYLRNDAFNRVADFYAVDIGNSGVEIRGSFSNAGNDI